MDDNDIYKRVKRLEDDLRSFKGTQPVGTDSVVTYRLLTNNEWDYIGVLPPNTMGFGTASQYRFVIKYISSDQIAPFARAFAWAEYNNAPINYASNQHGYSTPSSGSIRVSDWIFGSTPEELADPQLIKFEVVIHGVAGTPIKLKFGVDATDIGQMQIFLETSSGNQVVAYGQ